VIYRLFAAVGVLARFIWQCLASGWWYFGRAGAAWFTAMIVAVTAAGVADGHPAYGLIPAAVALGMYLVVGFLSLGCREREQASVDRARRIAAVMSDSPRPAHVLAHESGVNVGAVVALLWRMEARGWAEGSDGAYRLTSRGVRAFEKRAVSL
jgi:hypothetical protein